MNGRSFLVALWRRRWPALLVLIVEMAAVVVWLALAPKKYTAISRFTATPSSDVIAGGGDFTSLELTLAAIVNSRPVMQQVSDDVARQCAARPSSRPRSPARCRPARSSSTSRSSTRAGRSRVTSRTRLPRRSRRSTRPAGCSCSAAPALQPPRRRSPTRTSRWCSSPASASASCWRSRPPSFANPLWARWIPRNNCATPRVPKRWASCRDRPMSRRCRSSNPAASSSSSSARCASRSSSRAASNPPGRSCSRAPCPTRPTRGSGVNLAVALADVAHRVLLIDADFRNRPRHPALHLPDRPGLGEVLRGTASLEDAIVARPGGRHAGAADRPRRGRVRGDAGGTALPPPDERDRRRTSTSSWCSRRRRPSPRTPGSWRSAARWC